MKGAGGTQGGIGLFLLGFVMMSAGFYLLLRSISVSSHWGLGSSLYQWGGFSLTSGMVLIPFIFGIGFIFFNGRSLVGWLLTLGSSSALILGVIASVDFRFRQMTAFDLITILVLAIGGLGLFLRSLTSVESDPPSDKSTPEG
jgi:uncharacterized protein